jgi:ribosome-binding factor A
MSRRTEQVAEEIQRNLGDLLLREMRDPHVGFTTITAVDVSPDLEHARVHVSVLGSEEEERDSMRALGRASGYLRTELGKRMRMRHIPELRFQADRTTKDAIRIGELLRDVLPEEETDPDRRETPRPE